MIFARDRESMVAICLLLAAEGATFEAKEIGSSWRIEVLGV